MRALAIFLTIVGVCSAATFVAMDDKELEKVMMQQMYAQDPNQPFMGVGTLMTAQRQEKEQDPAAVEGEVTGEREARDADEAQEEPQADAPVDAPRQTYQPYGMFGNGMIGMMFPEMFASPQRNGYHHEPAGNGHAVSNGNGHSATPYAASKPNGHAVSSTNGNSNKRPSNGQSRPSNGNSRPSGNGNGNGKRGGSASAASAGSFNRGGGSFSQAQAFSGSF